MKHLKLTTAVFALATLAACSTPVPQPQVAAAPASFITQYRHSDVNEAASAYVSLYRETIEQSIQEQRYKSDLAYRYLSAEACFDSRADRLLSKQLSRKEKEDLVASYVGKDKIEQYQALAQGHFARINGLELFTCDNAGLKVSLNTLKN